MKLAIFNLFATLFLFILSFMGLIYDLIPIKTYIIGYFMFLLTCIFLCIDIIHLKEKSKEFRRFE